MKETEGSEFEELQIRDASKTIGEVLRNSEDKTELDLLHVNCEVNTYCQAQAQVRLSLRLSQALSGSLRLLLCDFDSVT